MKMLIFHALSLYVLPILLFCVEMIRTCPVPQVSHLCMMQISMGPKWNAPKPMWPQRRYLRSPSSAGLALVLGVSLVKFAFIAIKVTKMSSCSRRSCLRKKNWPEQNELNHRRFVVFFHSSNCVQQMHCRHSGGVEACARRKRHTGELIIQCIGFIYGVRRQTVVAPWCHFQQKEQWLSNESGIYVREQKAKHAMLHDSRRISQTFGFADAATSVECELNELRMRRTCFSGK